MATNKNKNIGDVKAAAISQNTASVEDQFNKVLVSWLAPEFIRYPRTWLWFFICGLIDMALLAYAYYSGSITMGLVFLVLPVVILLEQRKHPEMKQVIFSPYGIKFGERKFPYSEIKKFWILHHPPHINELHILTNNRISPEVTIHMMDIDPVQLRNFLVTQISELEGKKEPFLETLIRILKLA